MHAPMRLARGVLVWTLLAESAAAQPSTVTPSSAGGRVSGRVISSYAGLIADATITLTHLSATGAGIEAQTTTSDRQGAFGFERVAAGRYHLVASKPGYTNRQLPSFGSANVTAGFATGTGFTLSANEHAAGLELTLRHAASIAGRIAEPDGIPAPEVHVLAAVRRGDSYVTLPETRTTTAWDGRYDITGLPPGEYLVVVMPLPSLDQGRVLASAERRAPEAPASARPSFGATLYPGVPDTERGDSVTVFEGIAAEGIDVWLTPAQRYSVSGRVFWPDGLAAEKVRALLEAKGLKP